MSPCGWGNLGDAAIVDSLVQAVRRRIPGARIVGFTLNPEDTRARHGVEAYTLLGYSTQGHYGVREPSAGVGPEGEPAVAVAAAAGAARSRARVLARTVLGPPLRVGREARHVGRSLGRLRGAQLLVVAGGGQLDDTFGGPWGHPYALLRWGLLARAAGARFAFASVGTGSLSAASRFLVRRALALAEYRSFRDRRSRELIGAPEVEDAPVVPDLAYGREVQVVPPPGREKAVVGLSPMAFCHPEHWPRKDVERYQHHARSFGQLAGRLLREGHEVVLFTTDHEPAAVKDTEAAIGALPADLRARLRVASTPSVEALFQVLGRVDLVVAARLHGVLLAHVAHRPVLAVSHERKVRTLMEDLGQARHCLDIGEFEAEEGFARLRALGAARFEVGREIAAAVQRYRDRVEAQFDRLLGPVLPLERPVEALTL